MPDELVVDGGRVVPAEALTVKSARASGPGGQHVNRTETKVQISLDPRLVPWMDVGTRLRLVALAGRNVDAEGCIHVAAQEHREKERNLDAARDKLKALLEKALTRPKRRIATKPTKASKRRRLNDKRKNSERKERRQKPSD